MSEVAVVGLGGTGCAVLRLILSDDRWNKIYLIDSDAVSRSNLSRQFFYTANDIGALKADCLAARLAPTPQKSFTALSMRVEDAFPRLRSVSDFFCCVDNLPTRAALNRALKERGEPFQLIDVGSNRFRAHAFRATADAACLQCCIELYEPATTAALCSLRARPRHFEDCLARALAALPAPADVARLYGAAAAIAAEFGIDGASPRTAANFLNNFAVNIAPVNEAIACFALWLSRPSAENYVCLELLGGGTARKLSIERRADCHICRVAAELRVSLPRGADLKALLAALPEKAAVARFCLFEVGGALLYAHNANAQTVERSLRGGETFDLVEAKTAKRFIVRVELV